MSGNTWDTVENSGSVKGLADLVLGKEQFKVSFIEKEDDSHPKGSDGKPLVKRFSMDDLPDSPKGLKDGRYYIALTFDKLGVDRIGPSKGLFRVRCIDFVRPKEGEEPEPKSYHNKRYDNDYKAFTALLEIKEGRFAKSTIPMFLHYKFSDNGEGKAAFKGDPKKSPRLVTLKEFCELSGATAEGKLDWPENGNILPDLLSVILRQKREFDVVVKDGYVTEMMEPSEEDLEGGEDVSVEVEPEATDDDMMPKEEDAPKAKAKPVTKRPANDEDDDL